MSGDSGVAALSALDRQIEGTIEQVQLWLRDRSFGYALDTTAVLADLVKARSALVQTIREEAQTNEPVFEVHHEPHHGE